MGLYALGQRAGETCDAAGKAMRDVFTVLALKGSKTIWNMPKSCSKYLKILDLPYLICFLLLSAGRNDFIFYAIPENHVKIKILKRLQKLKKYKLICFINDLNAFRYGNADSEQVRAEMRREAAVIGMADHVLIPNKNTVELLRQNGVKSRLIPVGVWDYLMTPEQRKRIEAKRLEDVPVSGTPWDMSDSSRIFHIAFAGNLNKSDFLFRMKLPDDTNIRLELWGKLEEDKIERLPSFARYHGVLPADDVPEAVSKMDYGLVWDGSGADEIEGGLGEYLQYNNSHKCGLYLASGLPVIVWSRAGMAVFVRENCCGICIERLGELSNRLQDADYDELKKNVRAVSGKLQQGDYLSDALDMVLNGEQR